MSFFRPPGYKAAALLTAGLQALILIALNINAAIDGRFLTLRQVPFRFTTAVIFFAIAYLMYCVIARTREAGVPKQVAVAGASASAASLIFVSAVNHMAHAVGGRYMWPWSTPLQTVIGNIGPYALIAAAQVGLIYYLQARERERQLARARELAHDAQLLALRYQINPHFLFNTLNSISALVLDRCNEDAERMIIRLSAFFRQTLIIDPTRSITLAEEVGLQRTYLSIEEARFPDRFDVQIDISDEAAGALVPGLILQPLIENAVKHGMVAAKERLKIDIRAIAVDNRLRLQVANSPAGGGPPGTGTGLRNVRERLDASFGRAARVEHGIDSTGSFVVSMELPLRPALRNGTAKQFQAIESE